MKKGFTLAEVLITLAIIGVVAALTIPTLINNYNKKQWVSGLQKGYATLNNVFKMAMANDSVDTVTQTSLWLAVPGTDGYRNTIDMNTDYSDFIAELSKYMKIVKWDKPSSEGLDICYKDFTGDEQDCYFNKSNRLRIYSADGMIYYFKLDDWTAIDKDTGCKYGNSYLFGASTIEIDVNGEKGPNQRGRDLFAFALVNDGRVIFEGTRQWEDEYGGYHWSNMCNEESGYTTSGNYCGARIFENGWKMDY